MGAGTDDLTELASLLADRVQLLAAEVAAGEFAADLAVVRYAAEARALTAAALRIAAERASSSGHTWQEISGLLGMSPQAAYQRFGRWSGSSAPSGEPVPPVITDAANRAIAVLSAWFEGRYDAVAATFDAAMAETLSAPGLARAWGQLTGTAGKYWRLGDDEPLVRQLGDYTVADVPLEFEVGAMKGRVSFDQVGRVAGLYVLPTAVP